MAQEAKGAGGIRADELMAELAQDREYQAAAVQRTAELEDRASQWRKAEAPILEDLRRVGVDVDSVWNLVNTSDPYPSALPVLMEHLEQGGYPDRVLEGLARALAVKPAAVYWHRLRNLYLQVSGPGATEGLAIALAAGAQPAHLDELLALLDESSRGDSRVHLVEPVLRVGGRAGRQAVAALLIWSDFLSRAG